MIAVLLSLFVSFSFAEDPLISLTTDECHATSETGNGNNPAGVARMLTLDLRKVCTNIRIDPNTARQTLSEVNTFHVESEDCKVLELNDGSCPGGYTPVSTPPKIPSRYTVCKKSTDGVTSTRIPAPASR